MRIGLLWRAEWDPVRDATRIAESCRLHGMFAAFDALGVTAEPVVHTDEAAAAVREQLLDLDGVLVWVNPIEQGLDRSQLDPLLREVAAAGVWVSAHPDVIAKMATKEVLVETSAMSWSAETYLYRTHGQLGEELPARLAARGPLVLKQQRGMGGTGVWKIEPADASTSLVRVQHAAKDSLPEEMRLDEFVQRCAPYFAGGGLMVEQPFQTRLAEGMIRVYLSHDSVVGFAHQYPRGLMPPPTDRDVPPPAGKTFEVASAARFRDLRAQMESEWVPELQQIVGLDRRSLPAIWDADFLLGPKAASGADTYVLCEINASSTFAFPEHAMPTVAQAALDGIRDHPPPKERTP